MAEFSPVKITRFASTVLMMDISLLVFENATVIMERSGERFQLRAAKAAAMIGDCKYDWPFMCAETDGVIEPNAAPTPQADAGRARGHGENVGRIRDGSARTRRTLCVPCAIQVPK